MSIRRALDLSSFEQAKYGISLRKHGHFAWRFHEVQPREPGVMTMDPFLKGLYKNSGREVSPASPPAVYRSRSLTGAHSSDESRCHGGAGGIERVGVVVQWHQLVVPFFQGSLKDTVCNHLKHDVKGNHHLQGNVEVYNVSIPVFGGCPTKKGLHF